MARDKKPRSAIKDVVSREYTINLHKVKTNGLPRTTYQSFIGEKERGHEII